MGIPGHVKEEVIKQHDSVRQQRYGKGSRVRQNPRKSLLSAAKKLLFAGLSLQLQSMMSARNLSQVVSRKTGWPHRYDPGPKAVSAKVQNKCVHHHLANKGAVPTPKGSRTKR